MCCRTLYRILNTQRISVWYLAVFIFRLLNLGVEIGIWAENVWCKGKLCYSPGINTARIAAMKFSATFACDDPDLSWLRRLTNNLPSVSPFFHEFGDLLRVADSLTVCEPHSQICAWPCLQACRVVFQMNHASKIQVTSYCFLLWHFYVDGRLGLSFWWKYIDRVREECFKESVREREHNIDSFRSW
jgi:hypothetical protein